MPLARPDRGRRAAPGRDRRGGEPAPAGRGRSRRGRAARDRAARPAVEVDALPGAGVSARCRRRRTGTSRSVLVGNRRLLAEHGIALDADGRGRAGASSTRGARPPLIVAVDGRVVGLIGAARRRPARGARRRPRPEAPQDHRDRHPDRRPRPAAAERWRRRRTSRRSRPSCCPADKAALDRASGRRPAGGWRWSATGSTTPPRWPRPTSGSPSAGIGADLAAEAGDLVILGEPLRVLPDLVKLSRATVAVIRQNIIVFAFGLNAVAMGSAALGILGPVAGGDPAPGRLAARPAQRDAAARLRRLGRAAPRSGSSGRSARAIDRLDDRLDPGRAVERAARARWRSIAGRSASPCWPTLRDLRAGRRSGPARSGWSARFGRISRACSARACTSAGRRRSRRSRGWRPTGCGACRDRLPHPGAVARRVASAGRPARPRAGRGAGPRTRRLAADRRRPARRARGDGPVLGSTRAGPRRSARYRLRRSPTPRRRSGRWPSRRSGRSSAGGRSTRC